MKKKNFTGEYHRMKDIATALAEIADDTGYDYDYLSWCFDDVYKDHIADDFADFDGNANLAVGGALQDIADMAYEHDL